MATYTRTVTKVKGMWNVDYPYKRIQPHQDVVIYDYMAESEEDGIRRVIAQVMFHK